MSPELYSRIKKVSEKENEKFSTIARFLFQMGLYAYKNDFNSDLHSFLYHLIRSEDCLGGIKKDYEGTERRGNVIYYPFRQNSTGQGA
jgi:hypothetical protein